MGCPAMDGEVLFTNINHVDKWDGLQTGYPIHLRDLYLYTGHPIHLRDLCL
jgi:hypothetical protein